MVVQYISKPFVKVFGSRNDRLLKRYTRSVGQINALEPQMRALSDAELKAKTAEFCERADGAADFALQIEVIAVAREAMDRAVGIRNIFNPEAGFDVTQLSSEMQGVYERVKAAGEALEPLEVLGGAPAPGWMQADIPIELYDAVREIYPLSKPPFRARPFDVQLIGGMVLGEGKIAEMKTGEGKTIVGPLACYVACIDRLQCSVITVNDYLVQRDRDWVFPFYYHLGLNVGSIHPMHSQPPELKLAAYDCDVVYGTNSEFGFDYLRDNMKLSVQEQMQKHRDFCIIDEVDSILIDEARTPLIISGPAHDQAPQYALADQVAAHLMSKQREWDAMNKKFEQAELRVKGLEGDIRNSRDKAKAAKMREEMKDLEARLPELEAQRDQHVQYYEVEMERKAAHLTHEGIAEAQKKAGIGSFYVGNNMDFPHLLENAIRAHAVYQRDKDYVVRDGDVIIVDEFTGRLMIGRQWSDGLHQAVESKEKVKIKQETQTMATVTLQNYFKLFKRLAGMTGTAITESTEFMEIYSLDVVCIPTNVQVIRTDRDDLIYLSSKDKWVAITDEIKRIHDLGRSVLVGTTSVERSEMLSQMLTKRHGVKHEVLNAKVDQVERESNIVLNAGELGAVMIATNMAGRGTDIKLRAIDRTKLIRHWQQRNTLPKQASAEMGDDELIELSYRHRVQTELKVSAKEVEAMDLDEVRLKLFRYWVQEDAWVEEKKAVKMSLDQCMDVLDGLPEYKRHRLEIYSNTEEMGGLHIIGTERHESRRIDNQLRGRSGRQGDRGSSRFFISLEDDLMAMFAGKTTMTALSKLGMKEGDAIEHRWVTRSVERAQRKVEERNYEIRKNLLEYDEVMEYQRNSFYGVRQDVLEGKNVGELIFDYITDAVDDAVETYLDKEYVQSQVVEWCRQTLDISADPARIRLDDLHELTESVQKALFYEIQQTIDVTLGEYMSNDVPSDEWDLRGLSQWAMSQFGVDLKTNRLRDMNVDDVKEELTESALQQAEKKDLSELDKFKAEHYGQRDLANWAKNKFGIELEPGELAKLDADAAAEQILTQAREAYRKREVVYPVEFILDMVFKGAQQDQGWAIEQLIVWARQRYQIEWTAEEVTKMTGPELGKALTEEAALWMHGDKLTDQCTQKAQELGSDPAAMAAWMKERFGVVMEDKEFAEAEDVAELMIGKGRETLRAELTQLERFVLLQILDMAWKDHLYAMDQLKDSISLRSFAEKDPRIEYKREGSRQFGEMQKSIRDRVTELIFRARLSANVQVRDVYQGQEAKHDEARQAVGAGTQAAGNAGSPAQAGAQGTDQQQADRAAADRAGAGDRDSQMTRRQRRAAQARDRKSESASKPKQRKRKSR
jgi:preprotein translocase subunit SecA